MMLHIHFPKRSWMISFKTFQRTLPNCWHLDQRKKPPLWHCLHQLFLQHLSRVLPFFSLQWKTWCTVQILCIFCSNLECHSMNPKIGDCSLAAASDYWNGNQSVPITHSITLKKYEVVKYVVEKIGYDQNKWFICVDLKMLNFWRHSLVSQSTHVFCICETVETVLSIIRRMTGLCGRNWCLAMKGTSSTETEYISHCCTSSAA